MTDGAEKREFNPRKISPSRVNSLLSCGIAFEMKYLKGLPAEQSGSAALFGSVVHLALENWAPDRSQNLLHLMRQAWLDFADEKAPVLKGFIEQYQSLSAQAIRLEHEIREAWAAKGKESKAPRRTAEWKKSSVARDVAALMSRWAPTLTNESFYQFSEWDPLPSLYDESLVLAKRYESRWAHLPPTLHTEFAFDEPWRGFTLNGYIDSIELLVHPATGELQGVGVVDYKTYAKPPAEYKDWRQVTIYDAAVRALIARGALQLPVDLDTTPLYVGVDYVRWTPDWKDKDGNPFKSRCFWKVAEGDYERLERELNAYVNTVENRNFLPAEKGRNPDFCDYPSMCCLRSCAAAGGSSEPVEVVI